MSKKPEVLDEKDMLEYQKKILKWEGIGFDNRVHIVDHKTGQMLKYQPYRYVVDAEKGTYYIRNGIRYSTQGHPLDPIPEVMPRHDKTTSK